MNLFVAYGVEYVRLATSLERVTTIRMVLSNFIQMLMFQDDTDEHRRDGT